MTRPDWLSISFVALLAIGAVATPKQEPALVWNATASAPVGLYVLQPVSSLHAMDLVAIKPPEPIARFPRKRRLPAARGAAVETCFGARRSDGLPFRSPYPRR